MALSGHNWGHSIRIGQYLGIDQDMDTKNIAVSGALGAASPLLFGAGKAKGIVGKGYDALKQKVIPKAGETASGVSADAIRTLGENWDDIARMSDEGLESTVEATQHKLIDGINQAKAKTGKELEQAIDAAGELVDIRAIKSSLKSQMGRLSKLQKETDNKVLRDKISNVQKTYSDLFKAPDTPLTLTKKFVS